MPQVFSTNKTIKAKWVFGVSVLLFLFSNPIERQPIFLMIVFIPFIKINSLQPLRVKESANIF